MILLVVVLVLVAAALTVERIYFASTRGRRLRATEQSFVFHRLRDDLQALVVDNRLSTSSRIYSSLLTMLNLGIRNSTFRASEFVKITNALAQRNPVLTSDDFVRHVKMHDHEVQRFVAICFHEFAKMLVLNDPVYSFWRTCTSIPGFWLQKALDRRRKLEIHPLLLGLFPHSAEKYEQAAKYRAVGDDLDECVA